MLFLELDHFYTGHKEADIEKAFTNNNGVLELLKSVSKLTKRVW